AIFFGVVVAQFSLDWDTVLERRTTHQEAALDHMHTALAHAGAEKKNLEAAVAWKNAGNDQAAQEFKDKAAYHQAMSQHHKDMVNYHTQHSNQAVDDPAAEQSTQHAMASGASAADSKNHAKATIAHLGAANAYNDAGIRNTQVALQGVLNPNIDTSRNQLLADQQGAISNQHIADAAKHLPSLPVKPDPIRSIQMLVSPVPIYSYCTRGIKRLHIILQH
ncbi:hypothetical protein CPB84DRAFT_916255, partial [Gymnopilus junonius]